MYTKTVSLRHCQRLTVFYFFPLVFFFVYT